MGNVESVQYLSRALEIDQNILIAVLNEWEYDEWTDIISTRRKM
jgi:hypothetical protein